MIGFNGDGGSEIEKKKEIDVIYVRDRIDKIC